MVLFFSNFIPKRLVAVEVESQRDVLLDVRLYLVKVCQVDERYLLGVLDQVSLGTVCGDSEPTNR